MKFNVMFFLAIILVLCSCAGTTDPEEEQSEAFKVDMLEHSGDTGDIIKNSYGQIIDTLNCYYSADSTFYEFENSGVDAYHEGNWIYLPWRHISDPTTVSVEVFRFSYSGYQSSTDGYISSIDFIPFNSFSNDYYMDTFNDYTDPITDETWFYFVKTTNATGDTAFSDTVGYTLVNKPLLQEPFDGAETGITDSLVFVWDFNSSNSAIKYRLLIFNEYYELIWFYNTYSDDEPEINFTEISTFSLEPGVYIWRVDAIIERVDYLQIDGKIIGTNSGAESMERRFYVIE